MTKEVLKEFIDKEVTIALQEGIVDSMKEKAVQMFNALEGGRLDVGTKGAIFAFLMGRLGIHKHDINRIINIDDEHLRNLEIQYLIDRVFRQGQKPQSKKDLGGPTKYLYFGRKPHVY